MKPGGCSDDTRHRPGKQSKKENPQPVFSGRITGRIRYRTMTCAVWEWFMGRDEDELESLYDLHEAHPVWKTGWFRVGAPALCLALVWFFWPFV